MARYRDVNLVTKCSYLAIPFRDHSLPEAFRFTKIWPSLAGDKILRTRKPLCG